MASTASTAETLGEILNEYDALDEADRGAYRESAIEELHNHEPSYWKLRLGGMLVTLVSPLAYVTWMSVGVEIPVYIGYPQGVRSRWSLRGRSRSGGTERHFCSDVYCYFIYCYDKSLGVLNCLVEAAKCREDIVRYSKCYVCLSTGDSWRSPISGSRDGSCMHSCEFGLYSVAQGRL